jgi:hypothetical protein
LITAVVMDSLVGLRLVLRPPSVPLTSLLLSCRRHPSSK